MKRADLKVGGRYVVMAPSQRNKSYMFSEYHARNHINAIVTVVSLEPRFISSSYSRDKSGGQVVVEGVVYRYEYDNVHTIPDERLPEYKSRGWGERPGSNVLVLRTHGWKERAYNSLEVVPLANIAMTEAEYRREVRAHTAREEASRRARQEASDKAEAAAKALRAKRDELEELLDTDNVRVRILDGALALTGDLELFVQQARSDARVLEYLCNEDGALESRIVDLQVALATKENA